VSFGSKGGISQRHGHVRLMDIKSNFCEVPSGDIGMKEAAN
jgi:hypothetical protein